MCKTCHNDQQKLSKEEIEDIRKRVKLNKNPRPKRCTKEFAYCQKLIKRKNYKIYQYHTFQLQNNQISSIARQMNNSENRQNDNQNNEIGINKIKNFILKIIPSELEITKIETKPDRNCLIYAILKSLNISIKYHKELRELIADKTKEQNIDKKIL